MNIINYIRRTIYKLLYYYQRFQFLVLSIFVVGITEYFILYEILISLTPFIPILLLEVGPIIIIILSVIIVRGVIKFIHKKMKENKHLLII